MLNARTTRRLQLRPLVTPMKYSGSPAMGVFHRKNDLITLHLYVRKTPFQNEIK